MSAEEILAELGRRGARIRVYGERLRIEARPGAITTELRRALVVHKAELIAHLISGRRQTITCPGDDCSERIELVDGQGWCPCHKMAIAVFAEVIH